MFSTAASQGLDYALGYVAEREDVPTAQNLPVRADVHWPKLTADDLVIVPGWRGQRLPRGEVLNGQSMRRLREHHACGGTGPLTSDTRLA